MSNISISVRSHFTKEQVADLLDSASRGSAYWCDNDLGYESETDLACSEVGSIMRDLEEEKTADNVYTLNLTKIKKGLTCMAKKYPKDFADFLSGDYDQNTGDTFLQCCLFNEVIYG